ncbi:hypothetical protein RXV86_03940 [Alisedimentitalea sp. MJ-SS2]|uniref:hypothetical protein n=1 Tax=Aliisedimentitalea sp. MJ-SS2 TaxID=3049795 RepID=UPI002914DDB1|nr:hypothetical protein [Alisedimentitalea sp. MJ-SS2]MDU8926529.1 hypothetical protein [Alisedimentitalea sp. MJ-SS2]
MTPHIWIMKSHNPKGRLTTWWAIHGKEIRNIAIVGIGCVLIGGFRFFDPVERVGYHTATVHSVTSVSSRTNARVRITARIAEDRIVPVTLRQFTTHVQVGDRICLIETRGSLRNQTYFGPARPSRCSDPNIVPLGIMAANESRTV